MPQSIENVYRLGWIPGKYIAAGAANEDSVLVKTGALKLAMFRVGGVAATVRFAKVYDKATAPTSADTPVQVYEVPGSTAGSGNNLPIPVGALELLLGFGIRITKGMADNDTQAASSGDVVVSYGYRLT